MATMPATSISQKPNAGTCAKPDLSVGEVPNTNAVNIVTGSEMRRFFGTKLKALGGDFNKSQLARFGSSRWFGGVKVTTVPVVHSNGLNPAMVGGEFGKLLKAAGLAGYASPPTGYVLTFTDGLVAYLSGDTGITAEQGTVVRRH